MSKAKALLDEYNKLAVKAGRPKLTKAPKVDELQLRIQRLKASTKPKKTMSVKELDERKKTKVEDTSDLITVVDVANEMNMDPKVARAKLRRLGLSSNEGRWPEFKRGGAEHKQFIERLKPNTKKAQAREAEKNA